MTCRSIYADIITINIFTENIKKISKYKNLIKCIHVLYFDSQRPKFKLDCLKGENYAIQNKRCVCPKYLLTGVHFNFSYHSKTILTYFFIFLLVLLATLIGNSLWNPLFQGIIYFTTSGFCLLYEKFLARVADPTNKVIICLK